MYIYMYITQSRAPRPVAPPTAVWQLLSSVVQQPLPVEIGCIGIIRDQALNSGSTHGYPRILGGIYGQNDDSNYN